MSKELCGKKICIIASQGQSLLGFRGQLIRQWVENCNEVCCVSVESSEEMKNQVMQIGGMYYQVSGSRTGIGVISGLKMIFGYRKLFKHIKPDICYLYMSKPIGFGGLAAKTTGVPHINILVNGMENAYYRTSIKDFIIRCVMSTLYWIVGRSADNVFFQNRDDMQYFWNHHLLKRAKGTLILGSGVDMSYYKRKPLPKRPAMIMVARLLWSKGIYEYLAAAKIIKEKYPDFRVLLVGGLDENDEAISKEELQQFVDSGYIEYYGKQIDVRPYIEQASIYVLPSYHEGLPRSVLEAMSMGRAVITSNAPGCRETVEEGKNGYLVNIGDHETLAKRVISLIENPVKLQKMGQESYDMCTEKFEVNIINQQINNSIMKKIEE